MKKSLNKINNAIGKNWVWIIIAVVIFLFVIVPIGNWIMRVTQGRTRSQQQRMAFSADAYVQEIEAIKGKAYLEYRELNEVERSRIAQLQEALIKIGHLPQCNDFSSVGYAFLGAAGRHAQYDLLNKELYYCN